MPGRPGIVLIDQLGLEAKPARRLVVYRISSSKFCKALRSSVSAIIGKQRRYSDNIIPVARPLHYALINRVLSLYNYTVGNYILSIVEWF